MPALAYHLNYLSSGTFKSFFQGTIANLLHSQSQICKAGPSVYIRTTVYACTPYIHGVHRFWCIFGYILVINIRGYTRWRGLRCCMSFTSYERYRVSIPAISASFSCTAICKDILSVLYLISSCRPSLTLLARLRHRRPRSSTYLTNNP